MFRRLATAILLSITFAASALAADGKPHRIAIQIDQNDPQVMNLVLNNATNVIEYYRGKNEDVDVEIVAYGGPAHAAHGFLAGAGSHPAAQGHGVSRQDPVLGLQQHEAAHGEGRGSRDLDRAGGDHCGLRRGAPDGITGSRLELRPPLR